MNTNIILELVAIDLDKISIEYVRVLKDLATSYLFGGLPFPKALGRVREAMPKISTCLQPRAIALDKPNGSVRLPKRVASFGTPLPTSETRVGERMKPSGGHLIKSLPFSPHPMLGLSTSKILGALLVRPPTLSHPP